MADRILIYPAQIPLVEHQLLSGRSSVQAIGHALAAAYGQSEKAVNGFVITPGSGLSFTIDRGSLLFPSVTDLSNYGPLTADTSTIIQQAINLVPITLNVFADGNPYVIGVNASTDDDLPAVVNYFNVDNPQQTFAGPSNSGMTQPTRRPVTASFSLFSGTAVPDGWVPLYNVSVPTGTTQVTSSMVSVNSAAPFYLTIPQLQAQLASVLALIAIPRISFFDPNGSLVSGTWTCPATGLWKISAIAAGGSGGTASSANVSGGTGASGSKFSFNTPLTVGQTVTYSIGVPGSSSAGNAQPGKDGNNLTVTVNGCTIVAYGGGGGGVSPVATATSPGGNRGALPTFSGDTSKILDLVGMPGGDGQDGPTGNQPGGLGGGGGGRSGTSYGVHGGEFGSGGGAGYLVVGGNANSSSSGAGACGIVSIEPSV